MNEEQIYNAVKSKGKIKYKNHLIKINNNKVAGGFFNIITYDVITPTNKTINVLNIKEALEKIGG
jgi:hypothetical protein|tara:strand:+ start:1593 stop:1787 length:195 start_codon:yes stop_codon:yes gene_type:complete